MFIEFPELFEFMLWDEIRGPSSSWIGPKPILFGFPAKHPAFDGAFAAIDVDQKKRRIVSILWMHDQPVVWITYCSDFQITDITRVWRATCVMPKPVQCFRQGELSDRPLNRNLPGMFVSCPITRAAIVL